MSERLCALCQSAIGSEDPTSACPECGVTYHHDCHRENGGCGNYGCSRVPAQVAAPLAGPPTVWGRETKACPVCGREIRAAALRCRHCGAGFSSVESMAVEAYRVGEASAPGAAGLRVRAGACFLGGAIPILAPVVLLVGITLLVRDRALYRRLPPFYRFLGGAGLSLAAIWVLVGILTLAMSAGR